MLLIAMVQVSHGDVMHMYGINMNRCGTVDPTLRGLDNAIEHVARELIDSVMSAQARGDIGPNAHLVTHMDDTT